MKNDKFDPINIQSFIQRLENVGVHSKAIDIAYYTPSIHFSKYLVDRNALIDRAYFARFTTKDSILAEALSRVMDEARKMPTVQDAYFVCVCGKSDILLNYPMQSLQECLTEIRKNHMNEVLNGKDVFICDSSSEPYARAALSEDGKTVEIAYADERNSDFLHLDTYEAHDDRGRTTVAHSQSDCFER